MAEKYGFEVEQVEKLDLSDVAISSKIRDAIRSGDMKTATAYLGTLFDQWNSTKPSNT